MNKRDYPIILGNKPNGKPTKLIVGVESESGSGMDVFILGLKEDKYSDDLEGEALAEALDGRLYVTLHFCSIEAIDGMIQCLQETKELWEKKIMQKEEIER